MNSQERGWRIQNTSFKCFWCFFVWLHWILVVWDLHCVMHNLPLQCTDSTYSTQAAECTGLVAVAGGLGCSMACRVLVPQPMIEPTSPALQGGFFNHWTIREIPQITYFLVCFLVILFIYLTAPGLSCSTQKLLVVTCELLVVTCGV